MSTTMVASEVKAVPPVISSIRGHSGGENPRIQNKPTNPV